MSPATFKLAKLAVAVAVVYLFGCHGASGLQGRMPEPQTRAYRACTSHAQCTYVQNGCCDCANGGQDFAVARDQVNAFRSQFQCTGQCTEMYRECRKGKIACEQGLCVYHEPGTP